MNVIELERKLVQGRFVFRMEGHSMHVVTWRTAQPLPPPLATEIPPLLDESDDDVEAMVSRLNHDETLIKV